jgi:hypothetical protein
LPFDQTYYLTPDMVFASPVPNNEHARFAQVPLRALGLTTTVC